MVVYDHRKRGTPTVSMLPDGVTFDPKEMLVTVDVRNLKPVRGEPREEFKEKLRQTYGVEPVELLSLEQLKSVFDEIGFEIEVLPYYFVSPTSLEYVIPAFVLVPCLINSVRDFGNLIS